MPNTYLSMCLHREDCKSAWSMPRDNTTRRAICAYIRSLIHPNGPEAYCFHGALRRCVPTRRMSPEDLHVYVMDVAWHSVIGYLRARCPQRAQAHTCMKIPISRNMRTRFASYFHARDTNLSSAWFQHRILGNRAKENSSRLLLFIARRTPHSTLTLLSLILKS